MNESGNEKSESKIDTPNCNFGLADHSKLSVVFVLPNLQIGTPVESNYVGILPDVDPRVIEIAKRSPAAQALINNFRDHHGSKCSVSVMVVRQDAPDSIKEATALVSFRNMLAICCVLQSWQLSIGSPNRIGTLFSDTYDFYPYEVTRNGAELINRSYASHALDTPDNFQGQPYPELGKTIQAVLPYDKHLFNLLHKVWVDRFEKGRKNWRSNKLFRSLAIAYHACSLPKKNSLWIYDFGVSISLWVSAFEILAHPGKRGKSNLPTVTDLLSKARFLDPTVKRKRKKKHQNLILHGNGAAYLYWRLYESRNDFLHGNPVTSRAVLHRSPKGRPLLTSTAPILFAVALLCFFDWFTKCPTIKYDRGRVRGLEIRGLEQNMTWHQTRRKLEKALKHILGGKERLLN